MPTLDWIGKKAVVEACRIGTDKLKALGVIFTQLPYEIKGNESWR